MLRHYHAVGPADRINILTSCSSVWVPVYHHICISYMVIAVSSMIVIGERRSVGETQAGRVVHKIGKSEDGRDVTRTVSKD